MTKSQLEDRSRELEVWEEDELLRPPSRRKIDKALAELHGEHGSESEAYNNPDRQRRLSNTLDMMDLPPRGPLTTYGRKLLGSSALIDPFFDDELTFGGW